MLVTIAEKERSREKGMYEKYGEIKNYQTEENDI